MTVIFLLDLGLFLEEDTDENMLSQHNAQPPGSDVSQGAVSTRAAAGEEWSCLRRCRQGAEVRGVGLSAAPRCEVARRERERGRPGLCRPHEETPFL